MGRIRDQDLVEGVCHWAQALRLQRPKDILSWLSLPLVCELLATALALFLPAAMLPFMMVMTSDVLKL